MRVRVEVQIGVEIVVIPFCVDHGCGWFVDVVFVVGLGEEV